MKNILPLSLAVFLLAGVSLRAEDQKPPVDPKTMERATQNGAPSDAHKVLAPLVGKFTYTSQMWMEPKSKAIETSGSTENTWVLGGRFVKQDTSGDMMGTPYEGVGYIGYDNIVGAYESIWMQNVSTNITKGSGAWDPKTKTLSQSGNFSCPMTEQKARPFRAEWKIPNDRSHTYIYWDRDANGKEFKAMEIVYKRAG